MKKFIFTLIISFIFILSIDAKSINVKFSKCVDGDTAKFVYKDNEITARFLAIDTPETKHPNKEVEPFGPEASEYTCNKLTNAKKIKLEYDAESDEKDKYDRHLVWVFVDDDLLQKELVSNGLASVTYLYGDYKYTEELKEVEQDAENKKIGIWSINENEEEMQKNNKDNDSSKIDYKTCIILAGIIIMICAFSSKARKKITKEVKKSIKKGIKKQIKNLK